MRHKPRIFIRYTEVQKIKDRIETVFKRERVTTETLAIQKQIEELLQQLCMTVS